MKKLQKSSLFSKFLSGPITRKLPDGFEVLLMIPWKLPPNKKSAVRAVTPCPAQTDPAPVPIHTQD